jgi:hypothetical protein
VPKRFSVGVDSREGASSLRTVVDWAYDTELARPALIPGQRERDRKFADSLLEGAGFEPSVPRKTPGILATSALVRAALSIGGKQAEPT